MVGSVGRPPAGVSVGQGVKSGVRATGVRTGVGVLEGVTGVTLRVNVAIGVQLGVAVADTGEAGTVAVDDCPVVAVAANGVIVAVLIAAITGCVAVGVGVSLVQAKRKKHKARIDNRFMGFRLLGVGS